MTQITDIPTRAESTLIGDTIGVLALTGFTFALLHLPALI
jgi:hypothetical protein